MVTFSEGLKPGVYLCGKVVIIVGEEPDAGERKCTRLTKGIGDERALEILDKAGYDPPKRDDPKGDPEEGAPPKRDKRGIREDLKQ